MESDAPAIELRSVLAFKYLTTVCETAYAMDLVPMLWDIGEIYDRTTCKFKNPQLGEAFAQIAASPRP